MEDRLDKVEERMELSTAMAEAFDRHLSSRGITTEFIRYLKELVEAHASAAAADRENVGVGAGPEIAHAGMTASVGVGRW